MEGRWENNEGRAPCLISIPRCTWTCWKATAAAAGCRGGCGRPSGGPSPKRDSTAWTGAIPDASRRSVSSATVTSPPYVQAGHCAVEIGPGGGRWTRYLTGFRTLYAVDFHQQLLDELRRNFHGPNLRFIRNNGTDFPGVPQRSIDYLFSFGTFVHLDAHLIQGYLKNIKPILKPGANAVIQYADKTKIMAQLDAALADNSPQRMRQMVAEAGYRILEEDTTTLWHSSLVRFTI